SPKRPSDRAPDNAPSESAPSRSCTSGSISRARKRRVTARISWMGLASSIRRTVSLGEPRVRHEPAGVVDRHELHRLLHREIDPELLRQRREQLEALERVEAEIVAQPVARADAVGVGLQDPGEHADGARLKALFDAHEAPSTARVAGTY